MRSPIKSPDPGKICQMNIAGNEALLAQIGDLHPKPFNPPRELFNGELLNDILPHLKPKLGPTPQYNDYVSIVPVVM